MRKRGRVLYHVVRTPKKTWCGLFTVRLRCVQSVREFMRLPGVEQCAFCGLALSRRGCGR